LTPERAATLLYELVRIVCPIFLYKRPITINLFERAVLQPTHWLYDCISLDKITEKYF
jgi:hypothetical protein